MSVGPASVLAWREELDALEARLGELFVRAEPRRQAGLYLEGLLSAVKRKNGWQLAEQIGDARPWRTQRVLSHVLLGRGGGARPLPRLRGRAPRRGGRRAGRGRLDGSAVQGLPEGGPALGRGMNAP